MIATDKVHSVAWAYTEEGDLSLHVSISQQKVSIL